LASEALSIRDVDTYYGDSHVLHGVGFALQAGRLLGLLGRNGAGKTTCMATIMGFLRPRRGTIALFGENVAGLVPEAIARKGICLVPQGRRVFRSLTVRENLDVAAQKRDGNAWSADRVFALFPRLKERHAQVAGSLSGGEQQMLADRARGRPYHRAAQGRGAVDRAGGAEHQADPRPCRRRGDREYRRGGVFRHRRGDADQRQGDRAASGRILINRSKET
jgi:predicted ABC-type transport system involved in lysophospholipase L1 biosynthesis ATPase subunit